VLVEGKVEFVDDFDEKTRLLKVLMQQYSDREFKFSKPAVENVGVLKVKIEKISAKQFGVNTGVRLQG
jgi:nitroimidazol reductase NimA-like FMN-containing flavoprotein (pyridoxamine 5'-phosphate oxidase superfamily)